MFFKAKLMIKNFNLIKNYGKNNNEMILFLLLLWNFNQPLLGSFVQATSYPYPLPNITY